MNLPQHIQQRHQELIRQSHDLQHQLELQTATQTDQSEMTPNQHDEAKQTEKAKENDIETIKSMMDDGNVASIVGDRLVVIPSIQSLKDKNLNLFNDSVSGGLHGYSVGGYSLRHCGPRKLRNASLKRAKSTFEARRSSQSTLTLKPTSHSHSPRNSQLPSSPTSNVFAPNELSPNDVFVQRSVRKMMSQLSLSRQRSLSCGALSVVKE